MDLGRIERDVRRVPGVLACQVGPAELTVLVAPDADPAVVEHGVRAVLASAAAAPALRVLGGRAAAAPARHGRRALVTASAAGAALLAAAGLATALTGVLVDGTDRRPSIGGKASTGPAATVFDDRAEVGSPHLGDEAAALSARAVQPPAQLAALGSPLLLRFPLPAPRAAVRPAVRTRPAPRAAAPAPPEPAPVPVAVPAAPAAPPFPSSDGPGAGSAPDPDAAPSAPPPGPAPAPSTDGAPEPTASGDEHDNDRGEDTTDSNGHWHTGPQGPPQDRGADR